MKSIWLASSRYTRLSGGLFHHCSKLYSTMKPMLQVIQHYCAKAPGYTAPWSLGSRPYSTMEPRLQALVYKLGEMKDQLQT